MLWRQNSKSYNPDKTFIPRIFYYSKFVFNIVQFLNLLALPLMNN